MRAIVLDRPHSVALSDVAEKPLTPGCARVRIEAAAVCGSDASAYKGTSPLATYPRIPGHELVGIVEALGEGVCGPRAGTRVIVEPYLSCGDCYPCARGYTNCCQSLRTLGVQTDGGMCETIVHPARLLHEAPAHVSAARLALVEPLTIALHTVGRIDPQPGERVLVFGCGPIGFLVIQAIRRRGALAYAVEPIKVRREYACLAGAEQVWTVEQALEQLTRVTGGRGAECVAECSGNPIAVQMALRAVAHSGRIVLTGYPGEDVSLPTHQITRKEIAVYGSRNSKREFAEAISWISAGDIELSPLLMHQVDFAELAQCLVRQAEKPQEVMKGIGVFA